MLLCSGRQGYCQCQGQDHEPEIAHLNYHHEEMYPKRFKPFKAVSKERRPDLIPGKGIYSEILMRQPSSVSSPVIFRPRSEKTCCQWLSMQVLQCSLATRLAPILEKGFGPLQQATPAALYLYPALAFDHIDLHASEEVLVVGCHGQGHILRLIQA